MSDGIGEGDEFCERPEKSKAICEPLSKLEAEKEQKGKKVEKMDERSLINHVFWDDRIR